MFTRARALCFLISFASCGAPVVTPAEDASVDAGQAMQGDAGSTDAGAVDSGMPAVDSGMPDAGPVDSGTPDAGPVDAGTPDAGPLDSGVNVPDSGTPRLDGGTWRNSLSICWTDPNCQRVFAVAHGGAWDTLTLPYDSDGALAAAYAAGIDGVKIDVRVTADNVPIISHSSPLQLYESLDCYNRVIETSTAAQVTACHRAPSTTEKFQRLDTVLEAMRGKMVVQLTVKRQVDYARVIQQIHAQNAEDFAFMEITTSDLQTLIPPIPGSGSIWYVIDIGTTVSEVDTLLTLNNPRAFMYEFDPSVDMGPLTGPRLHPAGIRTFTYDRSATLSQAQIKTYFDTGFDVVSTQLATNAVNARKQVNTARGLTPP